MRAKLARLVFLLNWPGRLPIPDRIWQWAERNRAEEAAVPVVITVPKCDGRSNEGNTCDRPMGHIGCHDASVDGDSRRWWEPDPGVYNAEDLGEWRPSSGSMLRMPLKDGRIVVVDSDNA